MSSSLFTYKDNSEFYNLVEDIPGEKAMLVAGAEMIRSYLAQRMGPIAIIDFCCGTELVYDYLDSAIRNRIQAFVGVDISPEYLADARKRVGTDSRFHFIEHDAATYSDGKKYDIVFASSAYHHIDNAHKMEFLTTVRKHLADGGKAIFLENIIPTFTNEDERMVAAVEFYTRRILDCMDTHGIRDLRIPLLSRVMQYERDGEYEMKSHYNLFKKHLTGSGLCIVEEKKVWPATNIFNSEKVGDFAFLVTKA